jgi:homoserine dehydrogenase
MKPALKIAIAGLGPVGGGVLQLLERQAELVAARAGRRIIVAAVSIAGAAVASICRRPAGTTIRSRWPAIRTSTSSSS